VTYQGATALGGQLRAHVGDFFALAVCSCLTVLVSRFSDGGYSALAGLRMLGCQDIGTSGWLIPGSSHNAPELIVLVLFIPKSARYPALLP
jgi:hypothetical protein